MGAFPVRNATVTSDGVLSREPSPTVLSTAPQTSHPGAETSMPPSPSETVDACLAAMDPGANRRFSFEEITECLTTAEDLLLYMKSNLKHGGGGWDHEFFGENAYSPAREVFERGVDDCDGLAEFGACILQMNGIEAYNVGISILGPLGHNVTGFVGKDGLIYSIHNGESLDGPFTTWVELAEYYIEKGLAEPENVVWLFEPCLEETMVGDGVLDLPHSVIR